MALGTYRAGETPLLTYRYSRTMGILVSPRSTRRPAAYNALVEILIRAGWEPLPATPSGPARFRRRIL